MAEHKIAVDQVPPWPENADHFGKGRLPRWNVVCRLVRCDDVELGRLERQSRRVGDEKSNVSAVSSRNLGEPNLLRIDIDPCHITTVRRCEVQGSRAVAAADVEI